MRTFGREELELLKERADIVDVARALGLDPKREGKVFKVLCFLHPEKTPSMVLDPAKKRFICYGACTPEGRRGGDVLRLLILHQKMEFTEALDWLEKRYGKVGSNGHGETPRGASRRPPTVDRRQEAAPEASAGGIGAAAPAPPPSPAPPPPLGDPERAHLLDAYVTHCQRTLERSKTAQRYLTSRALFVPEVLRALRVGYADGSITKAFAPGGEVQQKLAQLRVLLPGGREAMGGMIVVPLLEPKSGAVLSLYGRSVRYRRHHYLAGELRGLVNGAVAMGSEELVVVESVLDALSMLALGVGNVLPIYGVNGWKADHDRLLEQGAAKSVTLLLDGDEAGQRATVVLTERLARRGLRVRAAALTSHKDPNDALVAGMTAEQMRQVLAEAVVLHEPACAAAATTAPPASPPQGAGKYDLEEIAEGFKLTVGPRRYRARAITGGGYTHLRMNLLVEDGYATYGDVFDLYVGRARTGFARRVARKFGCDEETVERELEHVRAEGEAWVLGRSKQAEQEEEGPPPPALTGEEKAEALSLLKDPKLLDLAVEHMTRLGYVGEETNKALGYLVIVSRKLPDPLSALILSQSAAGKSGLTEILQKMTPPEDVRFFSRLTPAALYHFKERALLRKVVIVEERSGSEEADYSLRTLQSKKLLSLAITTKDPRSGRLETVTKTVLGPAVFLETSTLLQQNFENSTRVFDLYLDESVAQTEKIHAFQGWLKTVEGQRAAAVAESLTTLHWNVQRLLEPVRVHIGYQDLLTFPKLWLRTRRDYQRFLNLIEASAFLHQYQRKVLDLGELDETEREQLQAAGWTVIAATVDDYAVAYNLAGEVLCATLSDLKKPARELLEAMKALAVERGTSEDRPPERVTLSRRELRERTGLPDHQVWRLLQELVDLEHVQQVRGSQGKRCLYRVPPGAGEPDRILKALLTPEELAKRIEQCRKSNATRTTSTELLQPPVKVAAH